MKARLRRVWESRAPGDRAIIAVLIVVLGFVLYGWFVVSAGQARASLQTAVTSLRAQAARLDQQAIEYAGLQEEVDVTASPTDLGKLVQTRIDESGLSHVLERLDAPEPDRVVVVFGEVTFADWLKWIVGLKAQHVRVETSWIEALSAPGLVSVTADLTRAKNR